ncbi:cell division protein FtsX [Desulfonema magnum]|uniref:Cell division protein FtsX n=1 Tax=Desulfonema magnum TaxID=45655 RepID=A0A975GTC1_9BACT|nr:permease-like cell division protein FtsX [Desulfonema magnum]QTA92936.1 Putative cell division protein, FtsX-like [Desulfonema magnum]
MLRFFKRAIQDILANRFLNTVTIISIALSVLIIGAFALFFINANAVINFWTKGIRIMAYLEPDIPDEKISEIKQKIQRTEGVRDVRFISKEDALELLRIQMKEQASLIDNLNENPLPNAFEIHGRTVIRNWEKFEALAQQIQSLPSVAEVEYGQKWLGKFINIFNLFRLTGYAMSCLFFMATVFFVANTIRLVLYSRHEEIEIMRLVGASESFIKDPFYIQSLIQGSVGGMIGLGVLFIGFKFVIGDWIVDIWGWKLEMNPNFGFPISDFQIRFLSPEICIGILAGSMFVGWVGCHLSLRQFLKL